VVRLTLVNRTSYKKAPILSLLKQKAYLFTYYAIPFSHKKLLPRIPPFIGNAFKTVPLFILNYVNSEFKILVLKEGSVTPCLYYYRLNQFYRFKFNLED
jgi:hypothetical protein